jgi:hypothetical protein
MPPILRVARPFTRSVVIPTVAPVDDGTNHDVTPSLACLIRLHTVLRPAIEELHEV